MKEWQRNLWVVWLAQFISIMSFAFGMPFVPYYMQQDLGVVDPARLKVYVTLFAAATPLTLAVFSPLWGRLADRYGRRPMLLRAYLGGTVILSLMGAVTSVEALLVLRLIQGALTGTVTASQALISAGTPKARGGMALGALSAAVFSGSMVGAFVGGWVSEYYGFRTAFYLSGGLMLLAALLVYFGVTEKFEPPPEEAAPVSDSPLRNILNIAFPIFAPAPVDAAGGSRRSMLVMAFPILLLIGMMTFTGSFDQAFLPLLVQEILGGGVKGASLWTGSLQGFVGIAGILAGFILGGLADRVSSARIGKCSAFGAGAFMLLTGSAYWLPMLFATRFATVFYAGGLDPVFQVWLARVTPAHCRGAVFGWAAAAKSCGWLLAPIVSGAIATTFDIRTIYLVGPILFFLLIPMIGWVVRKMALETPVKPGESVNL